MKSLARKHFEKAAAAKAAGAASAGAPQAGDQYTLMQAALYEARRALKGIKSIKAKADKKRALLPDFMPYIDGVLSAGSGAQDDVLMTVMVWLFDVGELQKGLEVARYAIEHKLTTPDRYARDTAALVAEQVAEEVLLQVREPECDSAVLTRISEATIDLTEGADMHDQIRAKLHKAAGYAQRAWHKYSGERYHLVASLDHLNSALTYNAKVGVKKDIEQMQRELNKDGDK